MRNRLSLPLIRGVNIDRLNVFLTRTPYVTFLLVIALIAGAIISGSSYGNRYFLGHDLRNRIVGARALDAKIHPYDLQALNATGEDGLPAPEFADLQSAAVGISAITANPLTLHFYSIYARGSWKDIRMFWFCLEWAAMFAALFLAVQVFTEKERRSITLICSLFSFLIFRPWHHHTINGQYYIFPTLLVCVDMWLISRKQDGVSGVFTGLAVAFRPMVLIIAPALWIMGKPRAAIFAACTGTLLLGSSLLMEPQLWRSYSTLSKLWIDSKKNVAPEEHMEKIYELLRKDTFPVGFFHQAKRQEECSASISQTTACESKPSAPRPAVPGFFSRNTFLKIFSLSLTGAIILALIARHWRRTRQPLAAPLLVSLALPVTEFATPLTLSYNLVMCLPIIVYIISVSICRKIVLSGAIYTIIILLLLIPALKLSGGSARPGTVLIIGVALLTYFLDLRKRRLPPPVTGWRAQEEVSSAHHPHGRRHPH